MMAGLKLFISWSGSKLFMSVSRLTGVQLVVSSISSIQIVLFDNSRISKCLSTLFLSSVAICSFCGRLIVFVFPFDVWELMQI